MTPIFRALHAFEYASSCAFLVLVVLVPGKSNKSLDNCHLTAASSVKSRPKVYILGFTCQRHFSCIIGYNIDVSSTRRLILSSSKQYLGCTWNLFRVWTVTIYGVVISSSSILCRHAASSKTCHFEVCAWQVGSMSKMCVIACHSKKDTSCSKTSFGILYWYLYIRTLALLSQKNAPNEDMVCSLPINCVKS